MKRILTLLFVFFSGLVFCQQPVLEWAKNFGGSLGESGNSIIATKDNELLIVGNTSSINNDLDSIKGNTDAWVLKLDRNGQKTLSKTYGGSRIDLANVIIQTTDGNFLVGGATSSKDNDILKNQGQSDAWLFKIDKQGNLLWSKTYGGLKNETIKSVIETTNGDILIGINSNSDDGDFPENKGADDWWILKLSKTGDIVWKKRIGGNQSDQLYKLANIDDKSFLVVGEYSSNDGALTNTKSDAIIKMDSTGQIIWYRSFGSPKSSNWLTNNLQSVSVSPDRLNIVAIGDSYNFDTEGADILVYKIDTSGNLVWHKLYGGTKIETGKKIEILKNGDIMCLGGTFSSDGDVSNNNGLSDIWLFLLDAEGFLKWQKSYGGSRGESGNDFFFTSENKVTIVATSSSDNGIFNNNYGNGDIAVIQVKYDISSSIELVNDLLNVKIFPNPVDKILHIQVENEQIEDLVITDLSGRVIKSNKIEAYNQHIELDCANFSSGTYVLKIKTENNFITRKIIVMR
jgi:Secretion system C-terminal sorting domain